MKALIVAYEAKRNILSKIEKINSKEYAEKLEASLTKNQPYFFIETVNIEKQFNPEYDKEHKKICKCGHVYYRHFDTYEQMEACGCKYCECYNFELKEEQGTT